MELTINVDDLSNIVVKSSSGETWRLIRESTVKSIEADLAEFAQRARRRIVSQSEVLKLYKIGHGKLKEWVAQGLGEIHEGGRVFYDLEEIYQFLLERRI